MENQYKDDSSSSFTADLFGSKQPTQPSSSTGFFASIFPPPKVVGSNSSCSELPEHMQKQSSGNYHAWSTKQGTTEVIEKTEGESNSMTHKERKIFQERAEPCPLSSSLYYGGPEDMYIHSSSTPSLDSFPVTRWKAIPMEAICIVLLEAIGGKGHFIIETLPYKGCEF